MNLNKLLKSLMAILVIVSFASGCAATYGDGSNTAKTKTKQPKPYDPTGSWEYMVETPDGGSGGVLVIAGNPGAYTATLETDQFGSLEMTEVIMNGQTMTGVIEVMGNVAEIECSFDGNTFTGVVYLGEDAFPMEGKREGN